jgi:hypothetical protein
MMTSIFLFGLLSLPFAAMSKHDYSHLTVLSTLYVALTVVRGVYTVVEGSYFPIFMRLVGWFPDSVINSKTGSTHIAEAFGKRGLE